MPMSETGKHRTSTPLLRRIALGLAAVYDTIHRFLAWITRRLGKPMTAEIYHAIEHSRGINVKGRVLLSRKWRHPHVEDPPIVNFIQMIRRWMTPERPNSLVRILAGDHSAEQRADREGYFEIDLPMEDRPGQFVVELPESEVSQPALHPIQATGADSRCLVISDIDDTVLVTNAARFFQMIATTLFGNALTRQLFPGSPTLYQALSSGPDPDHDEANPITYVTSSPFNLHGLIDLIFREHGLPSHAFFMTDWGLDHDKWFKKSHHLHKTESIEIALDWYPDKPVILIGDSGQHDTAIYVEMALAHPKRISLILIHDVSHPDRIEELQGKVEALEQSGTRFAFFSDFGEAAKILTQEGWISGEQCQTVLDSVEASA